MRYDNEVPSDDEVVATLTELGGHASALDLCRALVSKGHLKLRSQLAIQRAAERRRMVVNADWSLSLKAVDANQPQELEAA
jgi:hypothetical protein